MISLARKSGLAFMALREYGRRIGLRVQDKGGDDAKAAKRREEAVERRLRRMLRLLEVRGFIVPEIRQPGRGRARAYRVLPTVPRLAGPGGIRAMDEQEIRLPKGGQAVPLLPGLPPDVADGKGGHQCPLKADTSVRKGGHQCPPSCKQSNGQGEMAQAPASRATQDLTGVVLSLVLPGGPTERQQQAMAGPIAALKSAGATVEFLQVYLRCDLEGKPWARLERALREWCRRRKAEAETARQREAEAVRRQCEAAAAAADQPVDPPVDPVARAVFDRVGARAWVVWFDGVSFSRTTDGLTVWTRNPAVRDYVAAHFAPALQAAADGVPVRVEVAEVESGARPAIGGGG